MLWVSQVLVLQQRLLEAAVTKTVVGALIVTDLEEADLDMEAVPGNLKDQLSFSKQLRLPF